MLEFLNCTFFFLTNDGKRCFFVPKNKKKSQVCSLSQKNLGQHLLHNKRLIQKIIAIANIQSHETVVDIGAGTGAFTFPLADKSNKVIAVETDIEFAEKLRSKAIQKENIIIVQKDFLDYDLPNEPYVVVANIPYSITTPILKKLLHVPSSPFQRAVFVTEKGAAKRFTEKCTMNPYLLKWRMTFDFRIGQTIKPDNFSPPPRVDSAVLSIRRKQKALVPAAHHQRFMAFATYCLSQPKESISNILKGIFTAPQITRLLKPIQVDRYTSVSLIDEHQWAAIFLTMIRYVESYRWPKLRKK
jgi:23S rRNA (adenine-N6)-dimethyltransferase